MRVLIVCLAIGLGASLLHAQMRSGPAEVVDGDTLVVAGERLHLHGIDAPEPGQQCRHEDGALWPCGADAKAYLAKLIGAQSVTCDPRGRDRSGNTAAVCKVGDRDLNDALVSSGWALADREQSVQYVHAENGARDARRGMWAGEFLAPWEWRHGFRLQGEAGAPAPPARAAVPAAKQQQACLIKGNISGKGRRIYHLPGGSHYKRTKIDESKGERWFCSEEEARAAGWRPSG